PGSEYPGKFIGRPIEEIISETASNPTNADNFFERASAIAYTGYEGALEYHSNAGSRFEAGAIDEAYKLIDEGYEKIRNKEMKSSGNIDYNYNTEDTITWDKIKEYASSGHEFGSHTITHPRLAALDETNMLYELEKSREDILNHLGEEYTFSAECPYGTENERVMEYAHKIYPALRNRMPESWLAELNRGNKTNPGEHKEEYVQWQRGPVRSVKMETMKSWVDTAMVHDNIWLVLVFHGVEGIGWEPRTAAELEEYFSYMKDREENLWVATFAEVTKYLRERKGTVVKSEIKEESIVIHTEHSLDTKWYNVPLTFKTYVPADWDKVHIKLPGGEEIEKATEKDEKGSYVIYNGVPGAGEIVLTN
ncbi:MAG: polysaccharide deacetylase family protein, partial [Cyclobacteriaceae bacterium]|nr:polysaccharide deacetylase family protein [Cyclobacteriaceae bacterium]